MLIHVVEEEILTRLYTQQLIQTTFSQSDTHQSIYPMCLPFYLCPPIYSSQNAGSTFTVGSSDDQATSKDHLHPLLPSHKTLIYSFNRLILTPPIASQLKLQPLYHHSPHCHLSILLLNLTSPILSPSLLALILNNLILQN